MRNELSCTQCQDLLPWYVSTAYTTEHNAIEAHLATCNECQQALSEWQRIAARLRDDIAPIPVNPETTSSWATIQAALVLESQAPLMLQERMMTFDSETIGNHDHEISSTAHVSTLLTKPRRLWGTRARAIISAAAVVFLFFGAFLWYHAATTQRSTHPLPSTTNVCSPITTVTSGFQGLTAQMQIDHAAADLTGTSVATHINVSGKYQGFSIFPQRASVVDCAGNIYANAQTWFAGNPHPHLYYWNMAFNPLSDNLQGKTETLYLRVTTIQALDFSGKQSSTLQGLWQIPFTVSVATNATIISMQAAPIVHGGLGVAVTNVAWLYGVTDSNVILGDVRLQLHLTGLPKGKAFTVDFQYSTPHGEQPDVGNLFQLQLSNGQFVEPSYSPDISHRSATATGEEDIGIDFYIPFSMAHPMNTFKIDSFTINLNPPFIDVPLVGPPQLSSLTGPWIFQIPGPPQ